ncbi:MAG: hypothetical protein GX963_07850 [Bacteroidales bacterium]|nr:hypothetical protein [Bacteroidales bacterium]
MSSVKGSLINTSRLSIVLVMLALFAFPDKGFLLNFSIPFFVLMMGLLNSSDIKVTRYLIWGFLYSFITLASILWASNPDIALSEGIKVIQLVVTCYLLSIWPKGTKDINFVLKAIAISSIILGARLIFEVPLEAWGARRFGYLLGLNVNTLAIRLTFGMIISLYFMSKATRKTKFLYLMSLAFLTGVILLLGSRRSILIVIISISLYSILSSHNILKVVKASLISVMIGSIIIILTQNVPQLYVIIGNRIEIMINSFLQGHGMLAESRQVLIGAGIELFKEKPILGWGIGNYRAASGMSLYSHNNYVEVIATIGLLGLITYYSLHFYILLTSVKKIRESKLQALFFTITIAILMSDYAAPSFSSLFVHVFLAMSMSYLAKRNDSLALAKHAHRDNVETVHEAL